LELGLSQEFARTRANPEKAPEAGLMERETPLALVRGICETTSCLDGFTSICRLGAYRP
jgi:hypothetical protein